MGAITRQAITNALCSCADSYRVTRAYLFGSHARGTSDEASDVDLCIECEEGFTLFHLGGLGNYLEKALGVPVDIVCGEKSFYPKARERYRKDRVLVYEKS